MQIPHNCFCLRQVDHKILSAFIERSISESTEYQKLLKRTDRLEYTKRELEISEAQLFLLALKELSVS